MDADSSTLDTSSFSSPPSDEPPVCAPSSASSVLASIVASVSALLAFDVSVWPRADHHPPSSSPLPRRSVRPREPLRRRRPRRPQTARARRRLSRPRLVPPTTTAVRSELPRHASHPARELRPRRPTPWRQTHPAPGADGGPRRLAAVMTLDAVAATCSRRSWASINRPVDEARASVDVDGQVSSLMSRSW